MLRTVCPFMLSGVLGLVVLKGIIRPDLTQGRPQYFSGTTDEDNYDFVDEASSEPIIFPDTAPIVFEKLPKIVAPCDGESTFCENFTSYPYNRVKDILKFKHIQKDLFGRDEPPPEDSKQDPVINRFGGNEEDFVCRSLRKIVFPKVARNKNNKWKYVINQEESEGFIQGVQVEICRSENSMCDVIGDANGYSTACKQKYILRRLMSLSEEGDPAPDSFKLPSACCCSYKRNAEFLSRFGDQPITRHKRKSG